MADLLTDFKPSGTQQSLLGAFRNQDYDISVTDACKAAGITRETYYAWMRIEGFRDWWISEAERHFTLQKTQVFASIFGAATGKVTGKPQGSPQDRKLYLERFDKDYMPKSRKDVNVGGGMGVDLKSMSTEELERQGHAMGIRVPNTVSDKPTPAPMPSEIAKLQASGPDVLCPACQWLGRLGGCPAYMCPRCGEPIKPVEGKP